MITAIILLFM